MTKNIKRLAEARQKKGWTREEMEKYAKRKSAEYKKIAQEHEEPDCLASGTQKSIEEICTDDDKDD
ncbi:MAG: hypothetical protein WED00_09865 [Aquisalimonadaceae bacterium]